MPLFSDELLEFIHEPARLVVMSHLASIKKADFMFLLNSTELSRGNLSVQMSRLEEKGLVTVIKHFNGNRPQTVYEISRAGRSALKKYRNEILALLQDLPL